MTMLEAGPRQPSVTCQECGTLLGVGTTKDVFSHLVTCLHVELNTLDNIRDAAEGLRSLHGRRILHILDALQNKDGG